MSRSTQQNLRAALWTVITLISIRRQLRRGRVDQVTLRCPPSLPPTASRGVYGVLRRRRNSCLERALLLQAWYASQAHRRDVVIGVTAPQDFMAHAWLEGEVQCHDVSFHEILHLPPR